MRAYILAMIRHTCRRVSKGTLAECLRLEGSALDALVRTPETLTRLVTLDCGEHQLSARGWRGPACRSAPATLSLVDSP